MLDLKFDRIGDALDHFRITVNGIKDSDSLCVKAEAGDEAVYACYLRDPRVYDLLTAYSFKELGKEPFDCGADFVITQLFFDNTDFFEFRDHLIKLGVTVPIVPGIIPILSTAQIKRFTALCGAKLPSRSAFHHLSTSAKRRPGSGVRSGFHPPK